MTGVYVVLADSSIVGDDSVLWTFTHEWDADKFAEEFCDNNYPGAAWVTYEPISDSYDDPDFQDYRSARLA